MPTKPINPNCVVNGTPFECIANQLNDSIDDLQGQITTISGNTGGGLPYLVYTAIINQTGTNAPTALVLQNTLGANVTYSYDAVGGYFVNCPNKFTAGKTFVIFSPNNLTEQRRFIIQSTSQIMLITGNGAIYANDIIVDGILEIRVYP